MSLTIRERQIKCDTTTHQLECLKKKKNPGTIECWQRCRATETLVDGTAKWRCHLGKVLQACYLFKCTLQFHYKLCAQEKWNWHAQRSLYTNAYGSSIHNCQKLGRTEIAFNQWVNTQTVVHLYNGILFGNKKESTIDSCSNMNKS